MPNKFIRFRKSPSNQSKSKSGSTRPNSKLLQYIQDEKWSKAVLYVTKNPQDVSLEGEVSIPSSSSSSSSRKKSKDFVVLQMFPLHLACILEGPSSLIEILLECNPRLALEHVDGDVHGRLPLHVTLANSSSTDVSLALIRHGPEAVRTVDLNGDLPLHILLKKYAQMNSEGLRMLENLQENNVMSLFKTLVELFPDSIYQMNNEGVMPIDLYSIITGDERLDNIISPDTLEIASATSIANSNQSQTPQAGTCQSPISTTEADMISGKDLSVSEFPKENDHSSSISDIDHVLSQQGDELLRISNKHKMTRTIRESSTTKKSSNLPLNENELYSLMSTRKWREVCDRLSDRPQESSLIWTFPDGRKIHPLHFACAGKPCAQVLSLLIKTCSKCADEPDDNGRLPIHIGAMYQMSEAAMKVLIDASPTSVFYLDHHGKEPHSYAIEFDAPQEVVDLLLMAMAKKAEICRRLEHDINIVQKSSYKAVISANEKKPCITASLEDIAYLDEKINPTSQERASLGIQRYTLAEGVVRKETESSKEIEEHVEDILEFSEIGGKKVLDSTLHSYILEAKWDTVIDQISSAPLEVTLWVVGNVDGLVWKRLPIHEACRMGAPSNVVQALLNAYPESACYMDNLRKLPIVYACEAISTLDTIKLLISSSPNALKVSNNDGRTLIDLVEDWPAGNTEKSSVLSALEKAKTMTS